MASSSQIAFASPSSSDPCWKYDVFLSFRGPDTRKGITVDIYDGLNRRGIKTFMDDPDLKVGDVISPTLLEAIKKSWTHKELVKVIVEFVCTKVVPDAIESTGDFEVFEVTRRAMYEVMKAFTDDEVTAIGVYSMGGVGKTTLCRIPKP
uniref:toll/interleukin-1 receptor-like protein n=1 Tax=Fragaria vesca subsp. vesca TaxID=101020 RepID=UPI0005C8991F|nr:PREDICTED: toll/interleukin-1 receptor-like protein [Fragaria vesca subsp. vesca]